MTVLYVIITIIIAYCIVASALMINGARESRNIPPDTVGIVLGCTVRDNEPSPMLLKRCDRGYRYLKENENAVLILSGGREDEINRSEAQVMFDYLTQEKGIEASRLIIENQSRTTVENMVFSKRIMDEKGFGNRAVIITTNFHAFRSKIYAKREGIEPYNLCSRLSASTFLRNVVREWIVLLGLLKK